MLITIKDLKFIEYLCLNPFLIVFTDELKKIFQITIIYFSYLLI